MSAAERACECTQSPRLVPLPRQHERVACKPEPEYGGGSDAGWNLVCPLRPRNGCWRRREFRAALWHSMAAGHVRVLRRCWFPTFCRTNTHQSKAGAARRLAVELRYAPRRRACPRSGLHPITTAPPPTPMCSFWSAIHAHCIGCVFPSSSPSADAALITILRAFDRWQFALVC